MKILVTGTAGFIGDEVVGVDNINDYYDVNLKYGRLNELGIDAKGEFVKWYRGFDGESKICIQ